MLEGFFNKIYTGSRVAIVGVGIDHKTLDGFANSLSMEKGEAPKDATKFYGDDARVDADADGRAYVALGTQIAGGNNIKEAIAGMVLQRIWGKSFELISRILHITTIWSFFRLRQGCQVQPRQRPTSEGGGLSCRRSDQPNGNGASGGGVQPHILRH